MSPLFLLVSLVTLQILLVQNSKYSIVLGKLRQEDCTFEGSLGNTTPVRKKKTKMKQGWGGGENEREGLVSEREEEKKIHVA